ncbi:hypothetical protein EZV62_028219 [Acer yangbiense]|uniref:Uncharacterized protein n=1 Tax=Acer yangbiense TaxID=1000413 RepID=A0A5C7GP04_9ROSI|nr:hypothetical protein EZV62_028219 [Acer yangbiense]
MFFMWTKTTTKLDDRERSFLAAKLWLVLVPVIITVISNSKLVAACDEVFKADALGEYTFYLAEFGCKLICMHGAWKARGCAQGCWISD